MFAREQAAGKDRQGRGIRAFALFVDVDVDVRVDVDVDVDALPP